MALPSTDLALVVLVVSLIAFNILAGVYSLVPKCRRLRWKVCCSALLQALASVAGSAESGNDDTARTFIAQGVQAKNERSMQTTWMFLTMCLCFSGATVCVNIASASPRWMSFGQTTVCVVAMLVLTAGNTCLSTWLSRRPGVAYSLVMLTVIANTAFVEPRVLSAVITLCLSLFVRALVSSRYHRMPPVIAWNVAHGVVAGYTAATAFPADARLLIIGESWICFAVVLMSLAAARSLRRDLAREVETSILRGESSGLWSLLDLICDVVVPLDDKLRIAGKTPRFAALVMKQGKDMEGVPLQEFMPLEEDREAFENCVAPSISPPRALHVKLRDGMGNLIRVELFCVQVLTLVGKSHYIGIREFSDSAPIPECRTFEKKPKRSRGRRSQKGVAEAPKQEVPEQDFSGGPPSEKCGSVEGDTGDSIASSDSGSDSEASLPGSSVDASPCAGAASSQGASDKLESSDMALQLALVRLMRMCSEPARRRGAGGERPCCPFHSRVNYLGASLSDLRVMQCRRNFRSKGRAQCDMCGLFADEACSPRQCFACLSEVKQPIVAL